ncbi:MAG: ion transporter [Dehalococcoidia bacterium]|nr:ion transporter [Dehalococcoidia bacterium]
MLNSGLKLLRLLRIFRAMRVFNVLKSFRYSKSLRTIISVFKKQQHVFIAVGTLAIGYILAVALIMFNVEPNSFDSFLDAVCWATISVTTVGHGDIYPVSAFGRRRHYRLCHLRHCRRGAADRHYYPARSAGKTRVKTTTTAIHCDVAWIAIQGRGFC